MVRGLTLVFLLALAAPAAAVPDCPDAKPAATILSGQGSLESVIGGPDGHLYYTDTGKGALMRLDAPNTEPVVVADGIDAPGGLLLDGGSIIVGYGDGFATAAQAELNPTAGLVRVDLATGAKTTVAEKTSMSNGLARDAAGVVYASSDVGTIGIDRIVGSQVERSWVRVPSANGLAVSADSRYLFANQTFQMPAIQRIDLTDPDHFETYATGAPEDATAGLDGLTIDQDDRLYAAVNLAGEVWRIGTDRGVCALTRGLMTTSAVAFGGGGAFPATSLYAVGFDGVVVEIPQARALPAAAARPNRAQLRVRIRPRFVRARRRTRVTIVVHRGRALEPRAAVRLGHTRVVRTGARGRAHVRVRPRHRGFLRLRVRAAGVPAFKGKVRVLRADPGPRPVALTG